MANLAPSKYLTKIIMTIIYYIYINENVTNIS